MSFLNILGDVAKVAAPIVGTVVGGPFGALIGSGISKAIGGLQQSSQAKQLEAQNVRPIDTPEYEYSQNEAEANQAAQQGMPAQQYTNAENDIQRNQNFGLHSATDRNGGLASISGLVQGSNDATNSLNATDAQMQQKNQQIAYQIRGQLARRRAQAFDWNSKQKFLENASAIRALKGSSAQNIWGGMNTIDSASLAKMGVNPYGTVTKATGGLSSGVKLGGSGLLGQFGLGDQNTTQSNYYNNSPDGSGEESTNS